MTNLRTTYLLPCSCGRDIPIESRQAGETVHCDCGRSCAVPTMREVQCLRTAPAPASTAMPATTKRAWGNPQRFLMAGTVLCLLAATASVILYRQFPSLFAGLRSPQAERKFVESLPTAATIQYFRQVILPGIEVREPAGVESKRSRVYLGMAGTAVLGAIGLILLVVGTVGLVRRR